jgi:hypothetical protein
VFSTMLSLAAHSNNASQAEMVTHEASDGQGSLERRQHFKRPAALCCVKSNRASSRNGYVGFRDRRSTETASAEHAGATEPAFWGLLTPRPRRGGGRGNQSLGRKDAYNLLVVDL